MNLHDTIKALQNAFHDLVNHAEKDVVEFASPAITLITKNGGKILLALAEQVLAGAVAGTPWAENVTALVAAAEAQGITLLEQAARAALNMAQANTDAKGAAV
jgi:hypothetical protein